MAAAASSPLASSVEKTNGAKLSRLLIDGGTTVLRKVFDAFHPPANLASDLNSCYSILNNLLRRRILNKHQWDKLFPLGGGAPDSHSFDITLLFLLLTNICGLSPPPSGWHTKPPLSDTSLEANLARIKCFRNVLYGHVSTSAVDTSTFSSLWKEISLPLIALGLDQANIDRLKAESGGEEDYLDGLFEWTDSEEDIRSQLRNVQQTQSNTQQTVEQVRLSQMQDHETLRDSKSKLEEIRQIQTKTQRTTEHVRQAQREDRQTLQDSNSKLDEVRQNQTKTQQSVHHVCQTQMKDRETLQHCNSKLDEVRQTQTKTQQTVEHMCQIQMKERETLQHSNSKLDEVRQNQTKAQQTVERMHQIQMQDRETLQDCMSKLDEVQQFQTKTRQTVAEVAVSLEQVKKVVDSLKEKDTTHKVLRNLAKAEFKGDTEYYAQRFQADTREWVFKRVQNWLDDRSSPNRVMVITGNAGMGKSVIAAVISQRMQEAGRLSGNHFCQHNNARYRNPQLMLQSLACQLSHALPEYKQTLVEQLSRNLGTDLNNMGVEELFALLFKEPLSALGNPGSSMLMVIDGLDESEYEGRNELLGVIANQFCKLPSWIRFLVTSRPATNITETLRRLKPFQLEPDDEKNVQDIRTVLQKGVQRIIKQENVDAVAQKLVLKCEGLMLYAHFLILCIEENPSILDKEDINDSFPLGISSVYYSYFKRLEGELKKEVNVKEENFLNFLCAITASREPLPTDFVSKLLVPVEKHSPPSKRRILKALGAVSSLLPIRDGCLHVIHKSVKDWLTDSSCYGKHYFIMEEKEGHSKLASLCASELDGLKWRGVNKVQCSPSEEYALSHGVCHMFHLHKETRRDRLEGLTKAYVTNLELVYAKLLVNSTMAAEDIVWLQEQEISTVLSEDIQSDLQVLLSLLRKYHARFKYRFSVFLQTMLNEGGTVVSAEASNLLQNKYPEIPCMEYVHKETQQGRVLARFQCSSRVVCIDVSPKMDFMVCECNNRMLELWSLKTGTRLWQRVANLKKNYRFHPYREWPALDFFSFYRSVVFHPTKDLVLPGILSHAYTVDGDMEPLFVESNCRFLVCSISGDKSKMLTDCHCDSKRLLMWSLVNGSEIARITRDEDVVSFAWSRDGSLLAVSHSTGSICLLDVMSGFTTVAKTTAFPVCGMLKFSPDHQVLFCLHASLSSLECKHLFRFHVIERKRRTFSLELSFDKLSYYDPGELETFTDCGFVLGDPIPSRFAPDWFSPRSSFVLGRHTVIRTSFLLSDIEMLNTNEVTMTLEGKATNAQEISLSLDGQTVYIRRGGYGTTLMAWDVSSGEFIAEKKAGIAKSTCLVSVKEGVLLISVSGTLELWRFDLSKCVRRWTILSGIGISKVLPISEERVACVTREYVVVLDTTSGKILLTVPTLDKVVACNSKCQIITIDGFGSVQLSDGRRALWEKEMLFDEFRAVLGAFSPAEQFVAISQGPLLYILDVVSGKTLQTFYGHLWKFINDEHCVACDYTLSSVFLYNVKSGDLSNVIELEGCVSCLVACQSKHLFAIGLMESKPSFKVIRVWLPGDRGGSRRSERMDNTVDTFQREELTEQRISNSGEENGGY